jgi:diguanylate cyclase (GGDEF)-like protein
MEDRMADARAKGRLSVQSKLLGSFGLVVVLMLLIGLFAVARLGSDNQHLGRLATKVVPSTRAVGEIDALMNKYRKDQLVYIFERPAERLPNDLAVDPALMYHYLYIYRAQGLAQNAAEGRLLGSFQAGFTRYVAATAPFRTLADQGRISQANEVVGHGPGDAENDKLKAVIGAWSDQQAKTAQAAADASGSAYSESFALILALVVAAVAIVVAVALVLSRRLRRLQAENERLLTASRDEADTDALTGLANRRALMRDLENQLANASEERHLSLALFDLDGFKQYNDSFGHPAGDALLARLGGKLQAALEGSGRAYRMGGDEFCVLAAVGADRGGAIAARAASALSEKGEGFEVGCSYGVASFPRDASTAADALNVADERMYERKDGRASASRQSTDVLLKALSERNPGLGEHTGVVAQLAKMTAERFGLDEHEAKRIELAGELHDIGKVAIPESILNKPGLLDEEEWSFMHRHTLIGERILIAAPALAHSAGLVRSSHERYDGGGYPDGLAGEEIPLGAAIVTVCDAFDAMTSPRPYGEAISVSAALAELRRCSGSQFNPRVVRVFCDLIRRPDVHESEAAGSAEPSPHA